MILCCFVEPINLLCQWYALTARSSQMLWVYIGSQLQLNFADLGRREHSLFSCQCEFGFFLADVSNQQSFS